MRSLLSIIPSMCFSWLWLERRSSAYFDMADHLGGTTKKAVQEFCSLEKPLLILDVFRRAPISFQVSSGEHSKSASCLPAPAGMSSGAAHTFADLEQTCVSQWKPKPAGLMPWDSPSWHQGRKSLSKWYQASKSTFMTGFPQAFCSEVTVPFGSQTVTRDLF